MIQYPSSYRLQANERNLCGAVSTIINLVLHSLDLIFFVFGTIVLMGKADFGLQIFAFSYLVPMAWTIVDCIVCYHGLAYPSKCKSNYLIVSMAIHGVINITAIAFSIYFMASSLHDGGSIMGIWIYLIAYSLIDSGMYVLMVSIYLHSYTNPTSGQRIIYAPVKYFQNPEEMKIYSPNDNKL